MLINNELKKVSTSSCNDDDAHRNLINRSEQPFLTRWIIYNLYSQQTAAICHEKLSATVIEIHR